MDLKVYTKLVDLSRTRNCFIRQFRFNVIFSLVVLGIPALLIQLVVLWRVVFLF